MLSIIVCVDKNNAIGKGGELGFCLSSDLKNFKKETTGGVIAYGRKTLPSMGNKPLPNRRNVILSRDAKYIEYMTGKYDDVYYLGFDSLVTISALEDVFVCGGGEIYEKFMREYSQYIDRYIITVVDSEIKGADTFFPMNLLDKDNYNLQSEEQFDESGFKYSIEYYERKGCGICEG